MAQQSCAVVLTILSVGFALASCAFQSNSAAPLAVPTDIQPAVNDRPAEHEGKKYSAVGRDADCVMTTGDIHLWCKWITKYY